MYLIDSATIKDIKRIVEYYTVEGVTTNPTLLARENRKDYFHHLKEIQDLIAPKTLHVQVNAERYEEMHAEVELFKRHLAHPFAVKVPATLEGFKLMKAVRDEVSITATAISSFQQGLMAIASGASALALYINRMIVSGYPPYDVVRDLRDFIDRNNYDVTIVGASFKSLEEVRNTLLAGAHQVTVAPMLFDTLFIKPLTERSVKQFSKDFYDTYKKKNITE